MCYYVSGEWNPAQAQITRSAGRGEHEYRATKVRAGDESVDARNGLRVDPETEPAAFGPGGKGDDRGELPQSLIH